MASNGKTDSLHLNHWKLCDKSNIFTITETSSKLSDTVRINSLKTEFSDTQISLRFSESVRIRCINPAIHVMPLNVLKFKVHKDELFQKRSDSVDLNARVSSIYTNSNLYSSCNIQHCGSLIPLQSFKLLPTKKSKSCYPIERRCKIDDQSVASIDDDQPEVQRYFVNGKKIIKSSTSLSDCTLSQHDSGISISKNPVLDEWIKKKKFDFLRKKKEADELKLKKKIEEEKLKQQKEEQEKFNHYNFLVWIEKKRQENMHKRIIAKKEYELKRQIEKLETRTAVIREIYLKQWFLKKERERKAQKRNEELRIKKLEEERQQKLGENLKAFRNWQEKARNRSRPATQGLLPHQQAKPQYINPIPWVVDQMFPEINASQIINNNINT